VPLALPLILAGVRTAVVQVMATATLASIFGYQSLGSYLTEGLSQRDDAKLLTGTIAVGVLWLVAEVLLGLLQRLLTPWARAERDRAPRRRGRRGADTGRPDVGPTVESVGPAPLPSSPLTR
jgi:osmoprotectant transport system permease protein